MSRIAVTGGAGRLGRSLVAGLLGAGHEIVSLDRAVSDAPELSGAEQVAVDLGDAAAATAALAASRADALVHLAAIAVPFSAPEDVILRTNAGLAMAVLGGAVSAGITRVVAASSPTVIGYGAPAGWAPERLPIDEDSPVRPWNAYGLSKLLVEQSIGMLQRQTGDAVRFAAFRPCFVIAPEEWAGAPTQQGHTVRERLDDPALSAPALFNYVDARDVATFTDALLDALPEIPNGETFFVGAADALAREPLAELLPRFHPGTERQASALTGNAPAFSTAKAHRLLGWRPRHDWRSELDRTSSESPDADSSSPDSSSPDSTSPDSTSPGKERQEWSSTASSSSR